MAIIETKTYTLQEMKDKYVGKVGTNERDEYEYELRMEIIGQMIKQARRERKLTQEELGEIVGVKKSQISKLENSANSATIDTIVRVFKALKEILIPRFLNALGINESDDNPLYLLTWQR